ncbi:MAG: radical SAM protein [Candidatus Omnitrophica bacterium]|nr:radical SAM protein [Candidatus Omnitrophota bacterium]
MKLPYLLFADKKGKIFSHPYLRMSVQSLNNFTTPEIPELMPMPQGSTLFYLPGRSPVGFNPGTEDFETLKDFKNRQVFAVAAFTIPGILRLHNPAYTVNKKQILPLWAYTACGFYQGKYYIAAKRIDRRLRQSPRFYDNKLVLKNVRFYLKKYPGNRLYKHLGNCALNYNCLAAKNLFLSRWEAPLPTARFCNARCLGCLSQQESECQSSHQRINFKPSSLEITEVMLNHLQKAREPIVSFGQGCEGEPITEAEIIAESIYKVRSKTKQGTINMNTNASIPAKIRLLSEAGIDSFRVSLNSPDKKFYDLYFRPHNYEFSDVIKSIETAKRFNKFVSINLFIFPGFSDSLSQEESLVKFIKRTSVDMIQWRNLNIDPQVYAKFLGRGKPSPRGVLNLINTIKKEFPKLKHGYFNIPKEMFYQASGYGAI